MKKHIPWYDPFVKPFRYDAERSCVFDANNRKVLDIRGWGYLTHKAKDRIGEKITELINEDKENE